MKFLGCEKYQFDDLNLRGDYTKSSDKYDISASASLCNSLKTTSDDAFLINKSSISRVIIHHSFAFVMFAKYPFIIENRINLVIKIIKDAMSFPINEKLLDSIRSVRYPYPYSARYKFIRLYKALEKAN